MNETLKRAISGAVYILLLLSAIIYSRESFIVLFGLFLLIAVYEFCQLVQLQKTIPLVFSLLSFYLFYKINFSRTNDQLLLATSILVSIKLIQFLFDSKKKAVDIFSKYIYLIGYIVLPFVIITKIPLGINGYNPKIIIGIFILIWTNDTFAYLVGKSIGKHKLFERISPKKTIEGFLGGSLFAIIAAIIIAKYFIGATIVIWVIISFIVSIFGTLGDLIESKFKRMAGVKDSGNIMPGHGGILDRLDSIIFVAPFVYLFYQILYYVS